jgi:hypothetical protein
VDFDAPRTDSQANLRDRAVVRRLLIAARMIIDRVNLALGTCVLSIVLTATPVLASQAAPDGQAAVPGAGPSDAGSAKSPESPDGNAPQAPPEDDAVLRPAEPEYRLINLPTTAVLPRHGGSFALTHRFAGNLRIGSFGDNAKNLFGLDQGATIGFEYRFGIARHLQAAIFRTNSDRTVEFHGKYDAIRQRGSSPVAISGLLSVEATDNFTDDKSPALGASISRTIGEAAAFYATPVWVHNVAPRLGVTRDTGFVGIGGRVRIRPTVYVTAEVTPRFAGYRPGPSEFGFAIEKRAGGHLFQLNFTNTPATTYGQLAHGGNPHSLFLGFNLARKFF